MRDSRLTTPRVISGLEQFLRAKADELKPVDNGLAVDHREYQEHVNDDAHPDTPKIRDGNPPELQEAWLVRGTSYIWKVGVLAQWDSNKCDHAYLFIGHERVPGRFEFIGMLTWADGENDDIGRCLVRYLVAIQTLGNPIFHDD